MDVLIEAFGWLTDPENWQGPDGVPTRLLEHIELTVVSMVIACLIASPIALWLGLIG